VQLSRGIKGEHGSLIIADQFQLDVGGATVDEYNIIFEGNPEITFSPHRGGRIRIQDGGSIKGSPLIKAKLSSREAARLLGGRDHIVYEYLNLGNNVDLSGYNPTIGMSDITGSMGNFGTASDPRLFDNPLEFKSKFILFLKNRSISGSQGSKIVVYGGQKVTNHGSSVFYNRVREMDPDSTMQVAPGGTLAIELPSPNDVALFENNGFGDGSGDILNSGTVLVNGPGTVKFDSGGIVGNGTLVVDGSSVLDIHSAKIDQKSISFGERATLIFGLGRGTSVERSLETSGSDGVSPGGSLRIQEKGSLEGSPRIAVTIENDMAIAIGDMNIGETLESKYLFLADGVSIDNFKPSLLNRFRFANIGRTLDRAPGTAIMATDQVGVELGFGGTEKEPDYTILRLKKRELRDISREVIASRMGRDSENKRKAVTTFFSSMLARDGMAQRAIETEDEGSIRKIYTEHNPDSHLASQVKAMAAPIQSSAAVMADRMVLSIESSSSDLGSVLAATNNDMLAYGLLREETAGANADLLGKLWVQYIRNFGSQKLEENTKTSGNGFIIGLDYRLFGNLKLGLAFTLTDDSSESDSGNKNIVTKALSFYGEYDFGNLYLGAVTTYGWNKNKSNTLLAEGGIIYLAPMLGYRFTLKKDKNLEFTLAPELGIRYFHVHQGEQKDDIGGTVNEVKRDTVSSVLGLRLAALFSKRFDVTGRLGLSYDIHSEGDKSYLVTMYDGQSYQIVDERGDQSKFATELGICLGYKITDAIRTSIGYGWRYSSDLVNNNITLEVSLRF
jgi:outer membrane autotransporter protein